MNPLCPLFRFWKWIHWMNPLCPRNRLNRVQPTMDPWMFFEFAVGFIRFWIRQWIRCFLVGSIVGSIFFFESVNESVFFVTKFLNPLMNPSCFERICWWICWMNPLCPVFTFFWYGSAEWIRFVHWKKQSVDESVPISLKLWIRFNYMSMDPKFENFGGGQNGFI